MSDKPNNDFERLAHQQRERGLIGEFWDFLRYNKKWWLFPIFIVLILLGLLTLLSGTALAPFIYTLF
jgi:hypothetical protein